MKRTFILLGLSASLLVGFPADAGKNDVSPADERQKAYLWWLTVHRIWCDNAPTDKNAKVNNSPLTPTVQLSEVEPLLKKAHQSPPTDGGTFDLYGKVKDQIKPFDSATPRELADEILKQLRQLRVNKPEKLKKVEVLAAQFDSLLSAPPPPAAKVAEAPPTPSLDTKAIGAKNQADSPRINQSLDRRQPARLAQGYSTTQMALAVLAGALFGGLLVGWLLSQRRKPSPDVAMPSSREEEPPVLAETPSQRHGEREKLRKQDRELSNQIGELEKQVRELTKQNRILRVPDPPSPAPQPPVTSPPPSPTAEAVAVGETIGLTVEPKAPASPPPAPPAPELRYAPALEVNFLEDRQLKAESYEHLPIEITLDPDNRQRARFTFNPRANQAQIIGDGVGRLVEFFDFARPEKVSALRPGTPGELRREEGGWRVVRKAGLELS